MSENISEKEFEQGNEELFGVVNDHATTEATHQAEQIARAKAQADAEAEKTGTGAEMEARAKQYRRKNIRAMIVKMLVLTLAALLFLAALLIPAWVAVLCFTGLAACLIVGTIVIDRFYLSRR